MAELRFSKEGAGVAVGLVAVAMAAGADVTTAMVRLGELFGGAEGLKRRAKGDYSEADITAMVEHMTGSD